MKLYNEEKLKEHQKKLMKILDKFHEITTQNNIKYSLYGGTLLGAIRHKGFIPWDDDIDIVMLRDDFNNFIRALANNNEVYVEYDKSWLPKLFLKNSEDKIFIDIFIYDYVSENKKEFKKQLIKLKMMQGMIKRKINFRGKGLIYNILQIITYIMGIFFSHTKKLKWYKKISTKYNSLSNCLFVSNEAFSYLNITLPSDNFNEFVEVPFENKFYWITEAWETILKDLYGEYMELPPENKRIPEHFMKNNRGK